jgi:hypothetical protein
MIRNIRELSVTKNPNQTVTVTVNWVANEPSNTTYNITYAVGWGTSPSDFVAYATQVDSITTESGSFSDSYTFPTNTFVEATYDVMVMIDYESSILDYETLPSELIVESGLPPSLVNYIDTASSIEKCYDYVRKTSFLNTEVVWIYIEITCYQTGNLKVDIYNPNGEWAYGSDEVNLEGESPDGIFYCVGVPTYTNMPVPGTWTAEVYFAGTLAKTITFDVYV